MWRWGTRLYIGGTDSREMGYDSSRWVLRGVCRAARGVVSGGRRLKGISKN